MSNANTFTTSNLLASNEATPNTLAVYGRFQFRRYARTTLFWGLGISIYTVLMIASFPAFEGTGTLDASQYPEALREALNLTTMDAIEPYLSSQVYILLPLIVAFLPVTIFAGAIVGAEERGSLDILFGNPLARQTFVAATWLAVAMLVLVMFAVVGLLSYVAGVVVGVDLSFASAMLAPLNVLPIALVFGGMALVLSAVVRQRGIAIGVPIGIMFLMYLIDIIGKISETFAPLRNLSAFKAYGDVLQDGMPWGGFTLLVAIAVGLAALAMTAFQRRDIYT